jgi:hypothetical protein
VQPAKLPVAVVRLDERRLELAECGLERVAEAAERRGAAEAVQLGLPDRATDEERALRVGEHAPRTLGVALRDPREEIVERADRAGEQRADPRQQLPLDPLDVRPARHDEKRLAVERSQIPVEEQLDLPGVRGPDDQAQGHRSIVVRGLDVLPCRNPERRGQSVKNVPRSRKARRTRKMREAGRPASLYAAADFGLRPRRAAA